MKRDVEKLWQWRARSKPLRHQSRKGATQQRERRKALQEFGPSPMCRYPDCGRPAEDAHEPLLRSRGGDPADPEQIIPVCRAHHDWIHSHPTEATALGLMVPSWEAS